MQAKWLVSVDWNDDGAFSDPHEDVTSDVLGLTLEHFRDLASGYMESARLDLELRNETSPLQPAQCGLASCREPRARAAGLGQGRLPFRLAVGHAGRAARLPDPRPRLRLLVD